MGSGTPSDLKELRQELHGLIEKLNVRTVLRSWANAVRYQLFALQPGGNNESSCSNGSSVPASASLPTGRKSGFFSRNTSTERPRNIAVRFEMPRQTPNHGLHHTTVSKSLMTAGAELQNLISENDAERKTEVGARAGAEDERCRFSDGHRTST